jgi:hypothetical protein
MQPVGDTQELRQLPASTSLLGIDIAAVPDDRSVNRRPPLAQPPQRFYQDGQILVACQPTHKEEKGCFRKCQPLLQSLGFLRWRKDLDTPVGSHAAPGIRLPR